MLFPNLAQSVDGDVSDEEHDLIALYRSGPGDSDDEDDNDKDDEDDEDDKDDRVE